MRQYSLVMKPRTTCSDHHETASSCLQWYYSEIMSKKQKYTTRQSPLYKSITVMHKHEMTYLTLMATACSAEGPMHLHSGNTCVYTMVVNYPAQVAVDLKQSGAFVTSCASWWLDRFYTQINLQVFLYQILLCMPPNGLDRKGEWCIENMVNVRKT